MARGRMLSKSLSTSEKFAALVSRAPDICEFCHALYPLLVAHTDDFGRLQGDVFTVKHQCYPASPRSLEDFAAALMAMHEVELLIWYQVAGKKYVQVTNFDPHQSGLKRRSQSTFPTPDGGPGVSKRKAVSALDASEEQIEKWLVRLLKKQRLVFSGLTITSIDRQVRRESSYIDILATTAEGPLVLIEVKRQRVTEAAIAQVLKYRDLLGRDVVPVVIGFGLAIGQLTDHKVLIATYDDKYRITPVTSFFVKSREITLTHLPSEEKRTEQKGMEGNDSSASSAEPEPALLVFPCVGRGDKEWALTQSRVDKWRETYPGVDIMPEARRALSWLENNPRRQKTATGMPRFLDNWFDRTQNSGKTGRAPKESTVVVVHGCKHTPACTDAAACTQRRVRELKRGA